MIFRMALGGMTLAAAAFSLTTANAQQATHATDSDTPLQEVVVTANKREERLSTVGLTVSVLGASELTNNQITSLADIAKTIPGLSYANSANGTPVYTLRGVGFYETSI